jgi:CelD/BcsL family acetyltransferase involved in cellulose biosynthesis
MSTLPAITGSAEFSGAARGGGSLRLVTVRSIETLAAHRPAWRDLARNALESNIFYEPAFLLHGIEHLAPRKPWIWQVLLFYRGQTLVGLVPLQVRIQAPFAGRPLVLESLRPNHSFFHAPLLRRDAADPVVDALLDWFAAESRAALLQLQNLNLGGPFHARLRARLAAFGVRAFGLGRFDRPFVVPRSDGTTYFREALTRNRRRDLERRRRRLEAMGRFRLRRLEPGDDPAPWVDAFLALEASGWKGRRGAALATSSGGSPFLHRIVAELHREGQVIMAGLLLDDRWIAMTCDFRAARPSPGAFSYKTAYDERFRAMAPGVLLEIELLRRLHDEFPEVGWIDSCTLPTNGLLNDLWPERRTIGSVALAAPGMLGSVGYGVLEAREKLKGLRERWRPQRQPGSETHQQRRAAAPPP